MDHRLKLKNLKLVQNKWEKIFGTLDNKVSFTKEKIKSINWTAKFKTFAAYILIFTLCKILLKWWQGKQKTIRKYLQIIQLARTCTYSIKLMKRKMKKNLMGKTHFTQEDVQMAKDNMKSCQCHYPLGKCKWRLLRDSVCLVKWF